MALGSSLKIHTLDLNFQGSAKTIASYLLEGPSGFVLIETGPGSTLDTLVSRLEDRGFPPEDIKHVLVTHIHLDHAGAAGWFAQQGAKVYVHQVGAPHLVDPSRLLNSASRIYGAKMDSLWGPMLPAPAENIVSLSDGEQINAAGLAIKAIDTPGHAYHHLVYAVDGAAFTGDAAGIRIEGTAFADLPAPPPEFNLEVWLETLKKIRAYNFQTFYPTHFGPLEDTKNQLDFLEEMMKEASSRIGDLLIEGLEREAILRWYLEWCRERAAAAGVSSEEYELYEISNPHYMSVDGIIRYWNKKGVSNEVTPS